MKIGRKSGRMEIGRKSGRMEIGRKSGRLEQKLVVSWSEKPNVSSIKNDLKIVFYVLIYFSCLKMAIHCFYCMHKSNYLFIQVDIYFFNHQGQFYHDY